jgi:hypothetical protein
MNRPDCHRIAQRISLLLHVELGAGIEAHLMLGDPLYARDVLLVCDAHRGHELAALAGQFRQSAAAPPWHPPTARSTPAGPSSDFVASRPPPPSGFDAEAAARRRARGWFSPARWLGR